MHTLGHGFMPAPIHAGGLRYHGMAPLDLAPRRARARSSRARTPQNECFAEAVRFARCEGDRPGARAVARAARGGEEAARADEEGVERTILFNLCGHGHFDLSAYDDYLAGDLEDLELPRRSSTRRARCSPVSPAIG